MSGSPILWKAMGVQHACIRPDDQPVLHVFVLYWLLRGQEFFFFFLVWPCMWMIAHKKWSACHVNLCGCASRWSATQAAGWRVPCSRRDWRGFAPSQLTQTKPWRSRNEECRHCWSQRVNQNESVSTFLEKETDSVFFSSVFFVWKREGERVMI